MGLRCLDVQHADVCGLTSNDLFKIWGGSILKGVSHGLSLESARDLLGGSVGVVISPFLFISRNIPHVSGLCGLVQGKGFSR